MSRLSPYMQIAVLKKEIDSIIEQHNQQQVIIRNGRQENFDLHKLIQEECLRQEQQYDERIKS